MSANNQNSTKPGNPPIAKVRVNLITASIWERSSENGTFYAVSFERRFRDRDGKWGSSHSYDGPDLLTLAKVADLAHTKILELQENQAA